MKTITLIPALYIPGVTNAQNASTGTANPSKKPFSPALATFTAGGMNTIIQSTRLPVSTPVPINDISYFYFIEMSGNFPNGSDGCGGTDRLHLSGK